MTTVILGITSCQKDDALTKSETEPVFISQAEMVGMTKLGGG